MLDRIRNLEYPNLRYVGTYVRDVVSTLRSVGTYAIDEVYTLR